MALKLKETVVFKKTDEGRFLLDVTGYVCPHVQVFTEKALKKLDAGNELTVVFDNPSSGESISYLCLSSGDNIIDRKEEHGTFTWQIRRAG